MFEEEPFQMKTENADWKEESFGLTKGVPVTVAHTIEGSIKEKVPLGTDYTLYSMCTDYTFQ